MNAFAPLAGRYISAVRRRILIIRVAESIAISIAVASIAGLVLVPILWWRGQSALPLAEGMLVLGCAVGLISGISRRPSRLQAAIEADRQLGLHDLLGTVLMLDGCQSPLDWQLSIAAFADDRCRVLHPSAIIASRFGIRSWTGVGVLSGLLITFALLTAQPNQVTAESARMTEFSIGSPTHPDAIAKAGDIKSALLSRPPGPGGVDDNSSRTFEKDRPDSSKSDSMGEKDSSRSSSSGLSSSSGTGMATTSDRLITNRFPQVQNAANKVGNTGRLADGMGQSDHGARVAGENRSTSASDAVVKHTEPWTSAEWPTDVTDANIAIASGRVPEADADLIRDYFRRD